MCNREVGGVGVVSGVVRCTEELGVVSGVVGVGVVSGVVGVGVMSRVVLGVVNGCVRVCTQGYH